ncbi:unnamed protein product [Prorocentrum cordatum]|uniref:Uncharacterized protein n=1 Tax=Prorocentrum cordatum TaxID=2364126 RepID=A0ABN9UU21_9DINO|nr:unnamed protein product [Polarella glacialis]
MAGPLRMRIEIDGLPEGFAKTYAFSIPAEIRVRPRPAEPTPAAAAGSAGASPAGASADASAGGQAAARVQPRPAEPTPAAAAGSAGASPAGASVDASAGGQAAGRDEEDHPIARKRPRRDSSPTPTPLLPVEGIDLTTDDVTPVDTPPKEAKITLSEDVHVAALPDTQIAELPGSAHVDALPHTQVAELPGSTHVAALPKRVQVAALPKHTQVAPLPKSTQVAAPPERVPAPPESAPVAELPDTQFDQIDELPESAIGCALPENRQANVASALTLPVELVVLLESLVFIRAPNVLVRAVRSIFVRAQVSKAYSRQGFNVASFEIDDNPMHDFIGPRGFMMILLLCLQISAGGGFLAAPVCSTWIWLNRGTSQRSPGLPLGIANVPTVVQANEQVSNLTLVCFLLSALGIFWCVEQDRMFCDL